MHGTDDKKCIALYKTVNEWENKANFPMCFEAENFKTCFAFHIPSLETLFLEHSKLVKMTRKSQI